MLGFVLRRILYMIPVLVIISFVIFLLMYLEPGNVVDSMCGLGCPEHLREALVEKYGLEKSFPVQYLNWVKGIVCLSDTGRCPDFGYSPTHGQPAWQALVGQNRWVYTLMLVLTALIISWAVAIPIGIYSATHKYSLGDHIFTTLGFIGIGVPNFVLGLLFLWVVVGVLHLGAVNPFFQVLTGFLNNNMQGQPFSFTIALNFLWHFLPPVLILAAANTATVIRYMRGSLLDVLTMDYVQTARAKGLSEHIVIWKHAARNAINPLISMLGFWIPYMMEGALIIAFVFNLPQIETTFLQAIEHRDQSVVMAALFAFSVLLMIGNLMSDVLLAVSDPKIRYE